MLVQKSISIFLFSLFFAFNGLARIPDNDDIKNAILLNQVSGYCSGDAAYNNLDATASGYLKANSWNTEGKDVWFKFTAVATDLSVSLTGKAAGNSNTLIQPLTAFYSYKENVLTELIGSMSSTNNLTIGYKGGLTIGEEYYIRVSAEADAMGSFKLCLNNYNPPRKPGQDCSSASVLCNKETFTELSVSGAGSNNHEASGTCMGTESNSAWYTWTAANEGTLAFSITPTNQNDDVDWVLYDLGVNGNCSNILPANAIRCASGSGVNCTTKYYTTGLNMTATDLREEAGCIIGQDGFVKYIDQLTNHIYALLVDNFSSGNNGFTIGFTGTGEFSGPKSAILASVNNACESNQSITFTADASNYNTLKWNFGEGASILGSADVGPQEVKYSTEGKKTVTLETSSIRGCSVISSYTFNVFLKPKTPVIKANKPNFCINDVLELSIAEVSGATYSWTGPANFSAGTPTVSIPITDLKQAGDYTVVVKIGDCSTDAATITIPPIVKKPIAAFKTDPAFPGKFSVPAPIQFINQSREAEIFEWDFGDGETSNLKDPLHTYTMAATYTVTLRAYTANGCVDALSVNNLVLLESTALLIPNSFSPNGDGINDEFNVNISNLKNYQLYVFNRLGEKVFQTNNIFNSWKGDWNGQDVPVGAYFYVINGVDLFNQKIKYSGSITLIR